MSEIKNCTDGRSCRNEDMIEEMRSEIESWEINAVTVARLFDEQRARLTAILRIANDRLAAKENMASIQEAETLWEIVRVAEGGEGKE